MPPPPTILHVTHWKAGSQWLYKILQTLFPDRVVDPSTHGEQFLLEPVRPGGVYPTLYLARPDFLAVEKPADSQHFVIIRDLRDTLISLYFSFRNVHPLLTEELGETRAVLHSISLESGLIYLLHEVLPVCAYIQKTWLDAGERLWRYEDMLANDVETLTEILVRRCGADLSPEQIEEAARAHRFETITAGRKRGDADVTAHERKGIRGDWRNHFTDRVSAEFKARHGDLLIRTGYETSGNW